MQIERYINFEHILGASGLFSACGEFGRIGSEIEYTRATKECGDHAGIYQCSMLEELYPGSIKLERLNDTYDWFAESAKDMSLELGKKMVDDAVNDIVSMIKG